MESALQEGNEDLASVSGDEEGTRKKIRQDEGDEFSDDELELIQENYGASSTKKKLTRKGDAGRDMLRHIFDDDEETDVVKAPFREQELYDDDLDDFIIRDDGLLFLIQMMMKWSKLRICFRKSCGGKGNELNSPRILEVG